MAVKTTKLQCNQDVDLRGKADIKGKVTCRKDAEIDGNLIVNSAANIKDKSLTSADAGKVLTVNEDGSLSWQQKGAGGGMKAFFDAGGKCGYSEATSFDGIIPFGETSNVTDMNNMFYHCSNLTSVPLFDTSKVTNMNNMFSNCSSLTSVPLFDTSKVTNMNNMFYYCSNLTSVPLFDTSKVTYMNGMFSNCSRLTSVPLFDTSKVTYMNDMFYYCSRLTSVPSFDTSKVTNMNDMFSGCSSLETIHMLNIGASLDIHYSTKFTREALLEIIGNLKTVTSTKTLKMGSTNLAKLTDEDKTVATNKGWTLA